MNRDQALLIEIADYLDGREVPTEAGTLVQTVSLCLRQTTAHRPVSPHSIPAAGHLPHLCANAEPDAMPFLQKVVQTASGQRWRQNPNYQNDPNLAHFRQHYGYIEFVGPQGPMISPDIRCGLLLMAPRTTYPLHSHETVEFYITVAGSALWQRGRANPWRPEPAGKVIYHTAWQPHATRTENNPLLALYGWHGNVNSEAKMLK